MATPWLDDLSEDWETSLRQLSAIDNISKRSPNTSIDRDSSRLTINNVSKRSLNTSTDRDSSRLTINKDPNRVHDRGDTPEWRRRLVRAGKVEADLFGPTPLEGMFRLPQQTRSPPNEQIAEPFVPEKWLPRSHDETRDSSIRAMAEPFIPEEWQPTSEDPRMRTSSGMVEIRNENLSPISVSSRTERILQDMKNGSLNQLRPGHVRIPTSEGTICNPFAGNSSSSLYQPRPVHAQIPTTQGTICNPFGDISSSSLPEDLSMGTETSEFLSVSARRNARIHAELEKVRRRTPLWQERLLRSSPPQYNPPRVESVNHSPEQLPQTPPSAKERTMPSSGDRSRSSGSPLKLFGNYDTYTKDRLLRRMSQWDIGQETIEEATNAQGAEDGSTELDDRRMSQFGKGDLNHHPFTQETNQKTPELTQITPPQQGTMSKKTVHYESVSLPRVRKGATQVKKVAITEEATSTLDILDSKRGLSSPGKERTPKRRRTLQQDEFEMKEKALQQEETYETINRNQIAEAIDQAPADTLTKTVAHELASFRETFNPTAARDESRKKSITTNDYFAEATKVMDMIRANRNGMSQLGRVQEPETEVDQTTEELQEFSTLEEFSRPPSREGVLKVRRSVEPDPRVVSHLRKFEEKSDSAELGDLAPYENYLPESDPPNIRIREQTDTLKRKHSGTTASVRPASQDGSLPNTSSTGRSIPTGLSGSSREKGLITSDRVNLPKEVGGMVFDVATKTWVKSISEDDPFGGIPDLSVDELEELKRSSPTRYRVVKLASHEGAGSPPVEPVQDVEQVENTNDVGASECTPVPTGHVVSAPDAAPRDPSLLSLAELSDFTLHQVDDPKDVSFVAQRANPSSLQQANGRQSLAVDDMVKAITDVAPHELYWEQIRTLDLSGKKLMTLNRLGDYCSSVEELSAANNQIGQVRDLPSSLRTLRIQNNRLSNLSAWSQLRNLQYLDASGNEIGNLNGFANLFHLRELKVNDNKIRNLNGILELDGLLNLKLKGNELSTVNFKSAELTRLTHLDLSCNALTSVENLHYLPSLTHLDLSSNRLSKFSPVRPLQKLTSLKLSSNTLADIDLAMFPALELLYLDDNSVVDIKGLAKARSLTSLSIRSQTYGAEKQGLCLYSTIMNTPCNIRKLYLSANPLPKTSKGTLPSITHPQLSLQYLDLASCGISTLPTDFGTKFPNLRGLNLNFNAIKDITALVGIVRLHKILVAGNRIVRMRKSIHTLKLIGGKSLSTIDFRGNRVVEGYYDPRAVGRARDPFILPAQMPENDAAYARVLDEGTSMKRKVWRVLLGEVCRGLAEVDGLEFGGPCEPELKKRLVALGVLKLGV